MTRSATRGQIKGLTAALRAIPLQAAFLCLKRAAGPAEQGVGARGGGLAAAGGPVLANGRGGLGPSAVMAAGAAGQVALPVG